MTATIGTAGIERLRLRDVRYGVPMADVAVAGDDVLVMGSRQTLTVGDLAKVGTVSNGGAFGGQSGYTWIAGAGAWGTVLPQRPPYHDDSGVMLSRVAADLARDAGEIGAILDGIPDRSLGRDWTRPVAPARDLLDALTGGAWWMANDGVTHLGPRPAVSFSSPTLTLHYDPNLRRGTAQIADDTIAGLAPGVTLTAEGLTAPLYIGSVTVEVEKDQISVAIYGEITGPELFRAMVDAVTQWRAYVRANPYTVATVAADGRVAVQPSDARSAAFPDAPALGHMSGIPGATYTLAHGAGVAVVYLAADPGSPMVAGHLPGVSPSALAIDVSSTPGYASPWSVPPAGKITLGGASPLPIVVAVDASWFAQVNAALVALQAAGAAGAGGVAAALAARLAAITPPSSPAPDVADKAQASHL